MPDTKISVERHFKRATWKLGGGSSYRFLKIIYLSSEVCALQCIGCYIGIELLPQRILCL